MAHSGHDAVDALHRPICVEVARGVFGCVANYGERVEWKRATLERRAILCPLLWGTPFGLINVMRRAIPLTSEQHQAHWDNGSLPDWNYMPGEPDCSFAYRKPSNWGYLDRRENPVALDYPAVDVFNRWDGIDAINESPTTKPSSCEARSYARYPLWRV
jgi:hypothetical protein